ncbi:MAG: intradiol ring-cleavage dioxygenase [Myxococcota bacterium]
MRYDRARAALAAALLTTMSGCGQSGRSDNPGPAPEAPAAAAQPASSAQTRAAEDRPTAAAQPVPGSQAPADSPSLPACEWCGTDEAPSQLSWDLRIAGPEQSGERLVIAGTVHRADGTTPAAGIVMYLYHTDSSGIYPRRGDESGNGARHGYLRGWLRTDRDGQYRLTTIRPAPYPSRTEPAHIHVTIKEPDRPEYWLDSFVFADDPLVTAEYRAKARGTGGSGIVTLRRDGDGTWRGARTIVLPPAD